MKLLTPERMSRYDRFAIERWGIPSAVLMENAGRNTYRLMKERYLKGREKLAIFCGRGNNGGDGFVVARYALRDGLETEVFLIGKADELRGDAGLNMGLYSSIGGRITELIEANANQAVKDRIKDADIIVDAIFGTGLTRPVEGPERMAIEEINSSGKPVIAIDIPSGIDGKTGAVLGTAIKATHTFTYAYPKIGQVIYPGAYHTGRLTVIDISIPETAEEELGIDAYLIDGKLLRGILKQRPPWSHKGTYGHLVVIAGSVGKTGAAAMASLAALKIGAGLVTLIIPKSLNPVMEVKLTEVMTYPVEDHGKGHFLIDTYEAIVDFVKDKTAIVIGPGLSQEPETMELVRRLYKTIEMPFVVDADGINAFKNHRDEIKKRGRQAVFTPHPGELSRIIGLSTKEINEERLKAGKRFLEEEGANLVLKGARTVITGSDGRVYINPTGNPALAKGGSGDILTGFIGGLVAQGYSLIEASILGVYLHGYMADRWVEVNGSIDLLALDLLTGIGIAIEEIRDGKERIYIEETL